MGPDPAAVAAAEQETQGDETADRPAPALRPGRGWWARVDPALVALTVAGLVLRAWGVGSQSLWFDEWLTQSDLGGGPVDLVRNVANREGHPVPYFALLWAWARVFGDGEAALRSVSVLAGAATIPVAYALVHRMARSAAASPSGATGSAVSLWPARAAALLLAVNPLAVWYSREARPYALLCLAGGLLVLAAARAGATEPPARRDVVLLASAAAGAMAVHYFAIFLIVAVGVTLVVVRRGAWRTWVVAAVPTVIVLVVQAPVALKQHSYDAYRAWITDFPLRYRLGDAGRSALVGPSPPWGGLWLAVLVVLAVGVVAGLAGADRSRRRAVVVLAAAGAGAVALALAAVVGIDAVVSRYLIASLVPLVGAVALAAGYPRRGPAGWVGPAAVLVVAAASLTVVVADARDEDLQRPDWRAVARAFEAGQDGGERRALVVNAYRNLGLPLQLYLDDARMLDAGEVVEVDDVVMVVAQPTDVPCDMLVGRPCGFVFLGARPREPLGSALGTAQRQDLGQFALDVYQPAQPVEVGPETVVAADGDQALVFVVDP